MANEDKVDRSVLARWGTAWMVALLILLLLAPANSADLQTGLEAYERGDFVAALREFRTLAEQGHAEAQFQVGFMYSVGRGVPEDDAEAVKWYRKAAEQGNAAAQYNLGAM